MCQSAQAYKNTRLVIFSAALTTRSATRSKFSIDWIAFLLNETLSGIGHSYKSVICRTPFAQPEPRPVLRPCLTLLLHPSPDARKRSTRSGLMVGAISYRHLEARSTSGCTLRDSTWDCRRRYIY